MSSPLAATTVELARPCPEEGEVRCLGAVLRLAESTLASKVWCYHEAGCPSETQGVKLGMATMEGEGQPITLRLIPTCPHLPCPPGVLGHVFACCVAMPGHRPVHMNSITNSLKCFIYMSFSFQDAVV